MCVCVCVLVGLSNKMVCDICPLFEAADFFFCPISFSSLSPISPPPLFLIVFLNSFFFFFLALVSFSSTISSFFPSPLCDRIVWRRLLTMRQLAWAQTPPSERSFPTTSGPSWSSWRWRSAWCKKWLWEIEVCVNKVTFQHYHIERMTCTIYSYSSALALSWNIQH